MKHIFACILLSMGLASAAEPVVVYLSDMAAEGELVHEQRWGKLGLDVAAHSSKPGTPLRIGKTTFKKGLGHHADGRITVPLRGAYLSFHAVLGVQWQKGGRGSVRFSVLVDGKQVLEHGPVSDSDPGRAIDVPLAGAKDLCLVADSNGDGIICDMANWADARLVRDPSVRILTFGRPRVALCGKPAPEPGIGCAGGVSIVAQAGGPQVLLMGEPLSRALMCLRGEEAASLSIRVTGASGPLRVAADVALVSAGEVETMLAIGDKATRRKLGGRTRSGRPSPSVGTRSGRPSPSVGTRRRSAPWPQTVTLESQCNDASGQYEIVFSARGLGGEAQVRLERLRYALDGGDWRGLTLPLMTRVREQIPPPQLPELRPGIAEELIEWDWRMHDGIGTAREPVSWQDAIDNVLAAGDRLVADLARREVGLGGLLREWEACRGQRNALTGAADDREWERLWRRVHRVRRRIVFADPVVTQAPILFVKQVPSSFSHQLTQYYGMHARPGGGVFVLDAPGRSMACHELGELPLGSCQHPELSFDGRRVLFAYCAIDPANTKRIAGRLTNVGAYYHLYEIGVDGKGLRQITRGPFDDFAPIYLPSGEIMFSSTRRGGYHRCGRGPCPVYTLAAVDLDGSNPRVLSRHETHEWDPAVLNDGRVVYTRWDYVDRNAVYYQQLWTTHPDGTSPVEYFGNYTRNPVGIWEARPIPGSPRIMATAAAHHAMTAGSIIRIDVTRGQNTMAAITRLTPDVPFPESESTVRRSRNSSRGWRGAAGVKERRPMPRAAKRWPGHCYRSPYPLSETTFLAAYSYDPLIGEPSANPPNMFGLYVVDSFGNRELLYRDPNISSLWPIPIRPRRRPPVVPSACEPVEKPMGAFVVQDVYQAYPALPTGEENRVEGLRIVQVLPKTTPNANSPRVGWANASPGKQVLGTVPVEPDGSAYFRAPANIPLLFQALDKQGRSMQSMRSLTYLQPGETLSCIGCHEPRSSAPASRRRVMALRRPPSKIAPGPDGSNPLSYPLLVQPVLDKHCVKCHSGPKPKGGVALTAKPEKQFTESYNQLTKRVSYSAWGRGGNSEPLSQPGRFGARASKLMKYLLPEHEGVQLSAQDWERMFTWMDTTALFYGTFKPADQARQRRGERIAGPDLE